MEKENNSGESDFSENEIADLNSLKPFKFKPKTNIGDDEEDGAEYKVKRISNNGWCECSAKAFVGRCSSKYSFRPATSLKRDSKTGAFL